MPTDQTITDELKQAVQRNEFILYYQPQYNLETCHFDGVEALIRWRHPTKGLIQPDDFINYAEECIDVIASLGEWALKTACQQNKVWQTKGLPAIRVAVNVTQQQFINPNFIDTVENILKNIQLEPKYLELELSENMIIHDDNDKIIETIRQLKNLGILIALDDFGAGYSSINFLKKIPVDRIKIDKAYIQNIHLNKDDANIVKSIIKLADSMKIQVLAEGVESLLQLKVLLSENCKEAQGFYFSEPMTADEVEGFLNYYVNQPFKSVDKE